MVTTASDVHLEGDFTSGGHKPPLRELNCALVFIFKDFVYQNLGIDLVTSWHGRCGRRRFPRGLLRGLLGQNLGDRVARVGRSDFLAVEIFTALPLSENFSGPAKVV